VTVKIPKLPATFTGTGDLFAALFMAWMHRSGGDLQEAIEKTISSLQAVLQRTIKYADSKYHHIYAT
jgi:pyridoxine kinase